MPGAFTPTCSKEHLPGYIKNADKLAALGLEKIVVVTTNDKFVNEEWMSTQGALKAGSIISMVSDGDGDLVKSLGLAEDMGFGVGIRSKRFALIANNGVVSTLVVDKGMDDCSATSADSLIQLLTPEREVADAMEVNPAILGGIVGIVVLGLLAQSFGGGGGSAPLAPGSLAAPVTRTQPLKATPKSDSNFSLLNEYGKN